MSRSHEPDADEATGAVRVLSNGLWTFLARLVLSPPFRWLGTAWVARQRRLHRAAGSEIPTDIRRHLAPFFDRELLDSVRIRVRPRLEEPWAVRVLCRLGLPLDLRLSQAAGVTYDDTILLAADPRRDPRRNLPLLFHELVHVVQYRQLGVSAFLEQYLGGWIERGFLYRAIPLEIEACSLESRFRSAPDQPFTVLDQIAAGPRRTDSETSPGPHHPRRDDLQSESHPPADPTTLRRRPSMNDRSRSTLHLVGFAGSLRRASFNRALLAEAKRRAGEGVEIEILTLDAIPFYNQDVEDEGIPEPVERLRRAVQGADGLLIATPEYNSGIPGVLKNAMDWLSRPPKPHPLDGRAVAILGATPGRFGTRAAQYQLRQTLVPLNAHVMGPPMMLVAGASSKFDEGRLTDEPTLEFLDKFLASFESWARRIGAPGES